MTTMQLAYHDLYRVIADYTPPEEYRATGYLTIIKGDVLEVERSSQLEDGAAQQLTVGDWCTGWVKGRNRETNCEGYFPGEYVKYLPKPLPRPRKSVIGHRMQNVYFVKPVLCLHCKDYIWGTSSVGKQCQGCGVCLHNECMSSVPKQCIPMPPSSFPPIHRSPVPITSWTLANVVEWLAVVGLHRYVHIFRQHRVDGQTLSKLTSDNIASIQVADESHRNLILTAVQQLCHQPEAYELCKYAVAYAVQ